MPLLLDEDYDALKERGVSFVEDEAQRFLVLQGYKLPEGVYSQECCDILIIIPPKFPQAGNDMLWTNPRLIRTDGKPIPKTDEAGTGNNKMFEGQEFCRWSRHWNQGSSVWRPGKDDIVTILRRVEWAFRNPDAQ
ncbi:MAG: hypothetical protein DRR06_04370 [Gammaproteobacteria bacterium]|nr:MAG: hypothetical protein DRR06_04370 [Gammaproteobacteria bacterium]RLA53743.1 MAG: hypothetical protein DRR42_03850 [Gammaproteobacteria bacterium]